MSTLHLAPNELLLNVPNPIFKKLANALDSDQAWKKIVQVLPELEVSETNPYLQTPGEQVLIELRTKLCTIQILSELLEGCKLYDALSIIRTDRMVIKKQPTENIRDGKLEIRRGCEFTLDFIVWGLPLPKYFWYKNELLLPEQTSSKLFYNQYSPDMQGNYYCIATQYFDDGTPDTLKSNIVEVKTLIESCVIVRKFPPEIYLHQGETYKLEVVVNGYPVPEYQWIHKNKVLQCTRSFLEIKYSKNVAGKYICKISNNVNEVIVDTNVTIRDNDYLFPACKVPVIEKVALLIANEKYQKLDKLFAPVNDINSLKPILQSMGFLVIPAINLSLNEMKTALAKFCEMLVEGAYALLYFAGHGFELGEKYLLPVDAPNEMTYRLKDSISEYQILRDVLDTKPKLFLLLLDMCLKLPDRSKNSDIYEENKEIFAYNADRNLIQGYSTTSGLLSYEAVYKENNAPPNHSLYMKALKKYLGKNLPVLKILAEVNSELQLLKQMPQISFNVSQDFYLNVPKKGHPKSQQLYAEYNLNQM